MNADPEEEKAALVFQLSRKDLYEVFRVTAGKSLLRKLAIPVLAGMVLLGHSLDGNYVKGLVWALGLILLYPGLSRALILLHVFGSSNETLLVPQKIRILEDRMLVSSEHSREEFPRPYPSEVRVTEKYLLFPMGKNSLVFPKRSFQDPVDFEALKQWARGEN